jgi:hypothetical protein
MHGDLFARRGERRPIASPPQRNGVTTRQRPASAASSGVRRCGVRRTSPIPRSSPSVAWPLPSTQLQRRRSICGPTASQAQIQCAAFVGTGFAQPRRLWRGAAVFASGQVGMDDAAAAGRRTPLQALERSLDGKTRGCRCRHLPPRVRRLPHEVKGDHGPLVARAHPALQRSLLTDTFSGREARIAGREALGGVLL